MKCIADLFKKREEVSAAIDEVNDIRILRTFIGMDKDDLIIFYNKLVNTSNEKGLTYLPKVFIIY